MAQDFAFDDYPGKPGRSRLQIRESSSPETASKARAVNTNMSDTKLIVPERARCSADITSKKRVLELLSELISESSEDLEARDVFNCLFSREKLGSTGLGQGVAIPHGRMPEVTAAVGAAVTLQSGVDFDAPDGQPVDLVVGLIVPEKSTEEHLHILAKLAEAFSDEATVRAVREARTPEALSTLLGGYLEKV